MPAFTQQRRRVLLPAVLVVGTITLLARPAFVPGPPGDRATSRQALPNAAAAASLAAASAFAASLPAMAVLVDDPLAHGAPGVMDSNFIGNLAEKCTFGGLLVATILAWWRGTLGRGQVSSQEGLPPAFYATCFSSLSLIVLLCNRWVESGHFPLSNMYESLSFLAWGVTAAIAYFTVSQHEQNDETKTLAANGYSASAEAKAQTGDIAAVWATPLALGIVAFAQLSLPKVLQKASALVPALQSNWLMMHVSVVMCSYATLMFGSVLCMAVLALSQPKESPITVMREALLPALQSIANGLSPQPVVATAQGDMPLAMTASLGMDAGNTASSSAPEPARQVAMASSSGAATVEFSSSAGGGSAMLSKDDQLALTLDDLAYRSLLLGFGFLTIGIISGAVWANEAWGNYWSWDPKETWALITWLIYAGYLHTRLQLGWDTRDSAKVGAFGFIVVWVCYIGVNLMGIGLHSYGFFLK